MEEAPTLAATAPPIGPTTPRFAARKGGTCERFRQRLLASRLVAEADLENLLRLNPGLKDAGIFQLGQALVENGLLTAYQLKRIRAGKTAGLVLGNYRIVDKLGAGGMAVVYKAEHVYLKRTAAVKALEGASQHSPSLLDRFLSEAQAMAALSHPNIAAVFDAGVVQLGSSAPSLRYLAMEYVPGLTLERHVRQHGPFSVAQACRCICQAALGLQHAHERGLVHRDIKPSNLVLTPDQQIKILDFGLARLCRRRHTEVHALLGTLDYVAPEQLRDARCVDIRADIYGLGGTLYWLLTGKRPFSAGGPGLEELLARQREKPAPLRTLRPDLPRRLEAVVERMLAHDPDERFATPLSVLSALHPFIDTAAADYPGAIRPDMVHGASGRPASQPGKFPTCPALKANPGPQRILLVSGIFERRHAWKSALASQGLECREAATGEEAEEILGRTPCGLVLIDSELPGHGGWKLCHRLRADSPRLKLALATPGNEPRGLAAARKVGADDVIPQAVLPQELASRIRTLLRLNEQEAQVFRLSDRLQAAAQQLHQAAELRHADLQQAQEALIFGLALMVEKRGLETRAHLQRMQSYVRALAEEARPLPAFSDRVDESFVRLLERCVVLHDIGKVALPDHILLKPGKLDDEERAIMESHTRLGAEIVAAVARQHGAGLPLLQMAADIARHHHERADGAGYPDGLAGEAVPLAARFVALCDVYDALRSKLVYKPGLPHAAARRLILEKSPGQFDAMLLAAFRRAEASFEQTFAQLPD